MNKDTVYKLMDIFVGQFINRRISANKRDKLLHVCAALGSGGYFLSQYRYALRQGLFLVLVAGSQKYKPFVRQLPKGVILVQLAEKYIQLVNPLLGFVKLLLLLRKGFFHCLVAVLVGGAYKLLFTLPHIGHDALQICKDKLFQNGLANIVRRTNKVVSCPVAVVAASVSLFALQCSRAPNRIQLVTAIPTKENTRKQVYLVYLCRALLCRNPFLCKVKGFFINQRFMGVRKEVLFVLRVFEGLFRLIRHLAGFARYRMP